MTPKVYNPLDKLNLAKSIKAEVESQAQHELSDVKNILGAGIYLLYYFGNLPIYSMITDERDNPRFNTPIYVGRAIPKGTKNGGLTTDSAKSKSLASRLKKHLVSIKEAENLKVEDFLVKHLIVDDIWIPLGENILIETFQPVWNVKLTGFGINIPGEGRNKQKQSLWDVLHPGRSVAKKLAPNPTPIEDIESDVLSHFFKLYSKQNH
jgi:hypothetical protein